MFGTGVEQGKCKYLVIKSQLFVGFLVMKKSSKLFQNNCYMTLLVLILFLESTIFQSLEKNIFSFILSFIFTMKIENHILAAVQQEVETSKLWRLIEKL